MPMEAIDLELVHEDGSGWIYWNHDVKCVELVVKPYFTSGQYRTDMERALQLFEKKGTQKLLGDSSRLIQQFDVEDITWTQIVWFPRCLKVGMKFFAMAMPKALAAHMAVDQFVEKFNPEVSGFKRSFFDSAEGAREWLRFK